MAVYVDLWRSEQSGRGFSLGKLVCHMIADTHEELEAMARTIDMKPAWIQHAGSYNEHYDLTRGKRNLAIQHRDKCAPIDGNRPCSDRKRKEARDEYDAGHCETGRGGDSGETAVTGEDGA